MKTYQASISFELMAEDFDEAKTTFLRQFLDAMVKLTLKDPETEEVIELDLDELGGLK
jgi:hypothetical protein